MPGAPSQAYFSALLPDASNQVDHLTTYLMEQSNPWLDARGYVKFQRLPEGNGVSWGNLPSIQPFLKSVDAAGGGMVFGGLLPDTNPGTNTQDNLYPRPAPSRLFDQLSTQTNLVYYDWELTGSRIQPCLYLGQVARVISRHPQLPEETVSVGWLQAIQPRLGPSTTTITCTGHQSTHFLPQIHRRLHRRRTATPRRLAGVPAVSLRPVFLAAHARPAAVTRDKEVTGNR